MVWRVGQNKAQSERACQMTSPKASKIPLITIQAVNSLGFRLGIPFFI